MITLNDISILIVTTANDVNRLQEVYNCIRQQYPNNEIVIVYDNLFETILTNKDINLIQIPAKKRVYVSEGYNLAIKNSTKPAFVFMHDDTYPAPDFLENMLPYISENTFVNFCQVEPPVFNQPDSIYKPIRNFGLKNSPFQYKEFKEFYYEHIKKLPYNTEPSLYGGFFMAGMKKSFLSIGGFDELFKPYFFEDSDLMIRLHQAGFKFILVLNSLVYHVGSLTSRYTYDSTSAHKITENIFLKKWKTTFDEIKKWTMLEGIKYKDPNTKIIYKNINNENLKLLLNTLSNPNGLIEVNIDGEKINNDDIGYLLQLPYIIQQIKENGIYEVGNLTIKTNKI